MIQKNYILHSLNFKIQEKYSTGVQAEKTNSRTWQVGFGGGGEEVKLDSLFYGDHSLPEDKIAMSTDFLVGSPNFTTKQNIL